MGFCFEAGSIFCVDTYFEGIVLWSYMGKGGMVGGGPTPLTAKILANHPPYDVGLRALGCGEFLAAKGGRKFFHPPLGNHFFQNHHPSKKILTNFY